MDVIPHAGYYEFKKDSDANDMTVVMDRFSFSYLLLDHILSYRA